MLDISSLSCFHNQCQPFRCTTIMKPPWLELTINVYNEKSMHISLRHKYIRQLMENGIISIVFVRLSKNLANPFTMALSQPFKRITNNSNSTLSRFSINRFMLWSLCLTLIKYKLNNVFISSWTPFPCMPIFKGEFYP